MNAGNDPACAGKDQNVCDAMGAMLLAKGKLCAKMIQVTPLTPREQVINLNAAKQIDLTIPPNVLARADKVIR